MQSKHRKFAALRFAALEARAHHWGVPAAPMTNLQAAVPRNRSPRSSSIVFASRVKHLIAPASRGSGSALLWACPACPIEASKAPIKSMRSGIGRGSGVPPLPLPSPRARGRTLRRVLPRLRWRAHLSEVRAAADTTRRARAQFSAAAAPSQHTHARGSRPVAPRPARQRRAPPPGSPPPAHACGRAIGRARGSAIWAHRRTDGRDARCVPPARGGAGRGHLLRVRPYGCMYRR